MSEPMLPLQKAVLFFFLFYLVCVHVGVGGGRKRSHDMAYMWKSEGNFSLGKNISPGVLETDRSSGLPGKHFHPLVHHASPGRYFLSEVPIEWVARTTNGQSYLLTSF